MEKILCVEDDHHILQLYQEELSEEGYQVIPARNGKEALARFGAELPDLVIMDIRMPQMDGVETLTAMLRKQRQIPVILNTASPQYRHNFMTWGAEAYLIKSADLTQLKKMIRELLQRKAKGNRTTLAADG